MMVDYYRRCRHAASMKKRLGIGIVIGCLLAVAYIGLPRAVYASSLLFTDNFEGYGEIYDGTSAGVDATMNNGTLTTLSANWNTYTDSSSGVNHYDYSFGTMPGTTDIKAWTSNSTSTSVTDSGLSLRTGQIYYANVRVVDNAGNTSDVASSDGQLVSPTLSFGLSPSNLTFAHINANNGYTDSQATTTTTSTNAYGGYVVRAVAASSLTSGSDTIPSFSGGSYASPNAWMGVGFGYTSSDTSVQGSNIFQASPCPGGGTLTVPGCFAPYSQTAAGDIIADNTNGSVGTSISGEQFTITSRITSSATAKSGLYSTTLTYATTAIY